MLLLLAPGEVRAARAPRTWAPIPPGLQAEEHASVQPEAAVECVGFDEWLELRLEATALSVVRDRWVRLKVFTDEGAQAVSRLDIDIPPTGTRLELLEGRTVAPDGSEAVVQRTGLLKETVVRVRNRRILRYSFALPKVVPGSLVDYHVRQTVHTTTEDFIVCPFALRWPARQVTYHIGTPQGAGVFVRHRLYRVGDHEEVPGADGGLDVSATQVKAQAVENYAPPEEETQPLMLVYLGGESTDSRMGYWQQTRGRMARSWEVLCRPEGKTSRMATSIVGDEQAPAAKAEALLRWLRRNFAIVADDDDALRAAKLKRVESPDQALSQRGGTQVQAVLAFGALARAAGLDTRLVLANSRFVGLFDENLPMSGMLPNPLVAVKLGNEWRMFDPGTRHLPWDMVRLDAEGRQALICEPSLSGFVQVPVSGPERNGIARRMDLQWSDDGRLDGNCALVASGQSSGLIRWLRSDAERAEVDTLIRGLVAPDAAAEHLRIDSTEVDTGDGGVVRFRGRFTSADAAVRTARRMVLEARSVLVSRPPRLGDSERSSPVEFPMAMSETDSIVIQLPPGWRVDALDPPAERIVPGVLAYRCEWIADAPGGRLVLRRRLELGVGGRVRFPVSAYTNLRSLFEDLRQRDGLTASLVRTDAR